MTDYIPISVLEQLRTQDGQLFQNESILALYVDVKSFVWTHIISAIRTDSPLASFLDWSDDFSEKLVKSFRNVRPKIANDLAEAVRVYQGLLKGRFTHVKVVIQDAQIHGLLRGMFKRVLQHEICKSKQAVDQDPIKVDFLFREAFRMTLHHDCTILIETEDDDRSYVQEKAKKRVQYWGGESDQDEDLVKESSKESGHDLKPEIVDALDVPHAHSELALDDSNLKEEEKLESASVTAPPEEAEESYNTKEIPINEENKLANEQSEDIPRAQQDILRPLSTPKGTPRATPPSTPVGSVVSRAMTALTQVNQLRKPRVRTIVLGPSNDDDMHSRFTSSSRRK